LTERETRATSRWCSLLHQSELPQDGTGRVVEIEGFRLAVFLADGSPRVIDDECPHAGGSLGEGILSGGEVTCPWHAFHFDVCSGRNTDGLEDSVLVYPVRVRADGTIEVQLPGAEA
jgi:nitrite reductase/ring-hydroxylating ferredoxin subunit